MVSRINTSYLIIAFLFLLPTCSLANNETLPSFLPDTFNLANQDHFIYYSAQLINNGKLDEARTILDLGLQKARAENNRYLDANLSYYLADYYYYKEKYDSAHQFYNKVLPMFQEEKDTLMLAKTLNSLGLIYSLKLDNEKTLDYYLQETELLNQVKNKTPKLKTEEIVLLNNIINVYSEANEFDKVVQTCNSAMAIARELNDSLRLASILNSLALAQKNLGDIDQALATFKQASQLFQEMNDDFRNSFVINNIGGIYEKDDRNLDSALFYYNQAREGFEANNYQYGTTLAMIGVASIEAKKLNYTEAAKIYQEVIDIAAAYHFNEALTMAYEGLAQVEYDRKNYKKAFELNNLHKELNDSLFNEEKHRQYAELETKYKIIQKENEINLLKNEKLSQELKLEKANLQRLIGFILVIFLLVIIYIFVIFYNQKKWDNKLLLDQNQQIEHQNEQLKQMNENIQQVNKQLQLSKQELTLANISKNKFFSILAHDLKNPFHAILGQSFLLSKTYDKLNKEERKQYADEMYASCEQVNRLLDNLLEWSRTQSKGITFMPREINLCDLVANAIALLQKNAERKSIQLINECKQPLSLVADAQMLETILRNTINNGIKFTPEGGFVKISVNTGKNSIKLTIEDNGVGMEKKKTRQLFKLHSNIKTKGTNGERGTGLGLVICKEFVDMHNGKIKVESTVGKGSRFIIELPHL